MSNRAHFIKAEPRWFDALKSGVKTHEVRYDDRDYQTGDLLCIVCAGTAAELHFRITHVLRGGQYGIEPGWVVLSLARPGQERAA